MLWALYFDSNPAIYCSMKRIFIYEKLHKGHTAVANVRTLFNMNMNN